MPPDPPPNQFAEVDPAVLARRFDRERRARQQAETALEQKSRELYDVNEQLKAANRRLQGEVQQQTTAAAASAAWAALLIETALDAVVVIDDAGRIVGWNPQAASIFGRPAAEAIGRPADILFAQTKLAQFAFADLRKLAAPGDGPARRRAEVLAVDANGRPFPAELATSRMQADGWVTYRAFVRDISAAKAAREQAEQPRADAEAARRWAEAASAAKSDFLANMSHELRTPLNGVIGMLELLQGTTPTPEQRRYCDVAAASARALLDLIGDILDFSKIEAGRLELDAAEFDLPSLLDGAAAMLGPRATQKKLSLTHAIDADVPARAVGDATRLRQVLVNLVGNAVKFTDAGSVTVHVGVADANDTNATILRFAVRDTGAGIPPDRVGRLFQSFSQLDAGITRKHRGTGLGLAISRRLVSLMGGEIGVDSTPGVGSTFWFTCKLGVPLVHAPSPPTAQEHPFHNPERRGRFSDHEVDDAESTPRLLPIRAIPQPAPASLPSLTGTRVLLAEDNEVNQLVARRLLERAGCAVAIANNGREAVDAVAAVAAGGNSFDVILMDCQMPELDGLAATRSIRAAERAAGLPAVPIVALTANALVGDRAACLAAGMDDYVTKPIDPAVLFAAIAGLRRPPRAAA